ncbi:beta strand repeat-containing protein [Fibrella forsythiae]|uniref:Curlin associated repeat-containing protein n=1 Tax=Fibrella forsythiae TaxID=2817061 RepID=A0ABS3JF16_9BACT|nr:hypothetical protein [Fibrella forsythiae]MBO0948593.1 hypothetical protein [Fibrella forsythiae]
MKKIILTGTALMAFAAAGLAQSNNATLNQNGTGQTGRQQQTGTYLNANIQQVQGSGAASNTGNFAGTTQNTSGQGGTAVTTANINQLTGSNQNWAGVNQSMGRGSTATINQSTKSGGSGAGGNVAAGTSQASVEALGGNYGTVNQTGNTHTAVVNQNGNGTNASTGNFADVLQDGTSQNATTNQNAGTLGTSANNEATTRQYGLNNVTTTNQNDNSAGNRAFVNQYGADGADAGTTVTANTAVINQSGLGAVSSTNNTATINQGLSSNGDEGNGAVTTQRGNHNEVTVDQIGDNNSAGVTATPIIQVGNDNITHVRQTGDRNQADEIEAYGNNNLTNVDQVGNRNQAFSRMTPTNGVGNNNNNVKIEQTGNLNRGVFELRATNTAGQPASPNFVIDQDGANNYARMQVRGVAGTEAGAPGENNKVTIAQTTPLAAVATAGQIFNGEIDGSGNVVNVQQTGTSAAANMANTIGSESSPTTVGSRGLVVKGYQNTVDLTQNGTVNSINMSIDNSATGAGATGNQVTIAQTGRSNEVGLGSGPTAVGSGVAGNQRGLVVTGDANKVVISQNGGDAVRATQDGNDDLKVTQQGGNTSAAAQSNRVLINQGGGTGKQVADITQTGEGNFVFGTGGVNTFATQSGAGINTATVNQTVVGSGGVNNAFLNQNGIGNTLTITQMKP